MSGTFGAASMITITFLEMEKTGSGYSLYAQWKSVQAAPEQDSFWMMVENEAGIIQKQAVNSRASDGEMAFTADPSKVYRFSVSDQESGPVPRKCAPVTLLFDTYRNPRGEYDGNTLTVQWDKHSSNIACGEFLLRLHGNEPGKRDEFPNMSGKIDRYRRQAELAVCPADFEENAAVYARLTPCRDTIVSGPPARSGLFFLTPPAIADTELGSVGTELTVRFITGYEGTAWAPLIDDGTIMVQPVLLLEGREVCGGSRTALANCPKSAGAYSVKWNIADTPWAQDYERCDIGLYLCTATTRSAIRSPLNTVPLARPAVKGITAGRHGIRLSWDYPRPGTVFAVDCGGERVTTACREIVLNKTAPADMNKTITVKPAKSPSSEPTTAFRPGYYPTADGVRYYCGSYGNERVVIPVGEGFLAGALTTPLTEGPFTLGIDMNLTVDRAVSLTRGGFDAWLIKLADKGLTPAGYYRMRQWAARLVFSGGADGLYAYCGMAEGGRSADIFPGATLELEIAAYQFQSGEQSGDNAGMTLGATSRYTVSLEEAQGRQALVLDRFMHMVEPKWRPFTESIPNAVNWAGTQDFFLETLRLPYARLCYPQYFQLSDNPHSPFPADNIVMLLASTIATLDEASKKLLQTPAADITVPHILFRGRAGARLAHTVTLNGQPTDVPIGTRLCDLQLPYPLCRDGSASSLRFRRYAAGGWADVHLEWFDARQIAAIPLLGGDTVSWA